MSERVTSIERPQTVRLTASLSASFHAPRVYWKMPPAVPPMDAQSEAQDRAMDSKCRLPTSPASKTAVVKLRAYPPATRARCITQYALRDLPHLIRCALTAGVSADTRSPRSGEGTPVLCLAAAAGSARSLSALLDGHANVALVDSEKRTAAHLAVLRGHAPCLRLLLDAGAPKEAQDNSGSTPLHLAAQQGHEECCSVLLASGCAIDARKDVNDALSTSLRFAAFNGHKGVVRLLVDAGAQLEARGMNGGSLLHLAVSLDYLEVVQLLLSCGANPDAINDEGLTPLMHAATLEHLPCVRELLPVSDLSITNRRGWTAFHECIITGDLECFDLFLPVVNLDVRRTVQGSLASGCFNAMPLHLACTYRRHTMMRRLLRSGASRTVRDSDQRTALHRAAMLGDMGSLVLILGEP